jgi:hypothetical protein
MCLDVLVQAKQTMAASVSLHSILLHCQQEEQSLREASITNILRPVQRIRLRTQSCKSEASTTIEMDLQW